MAQENKKVVTYPTGFYYHYKHNTRGTVNNYAYEIMNIGHHTEIDGLEESAVVVYRPLYEASVYKNGRHWDVRPLRARRNLWYWILRIFNKEPSGFLDPVTKHGLTFQRFTPITDVSIIGKLKEIRDQLY